VEQFFAQINGRGTDFRSVQIMRQVQVSAVPSKNKSFREQDAALGLKEISFRKIKVTPSMNLSWPAACAGPDRNDDGCRRAGCAGGRARRVLPGDFKPRRWINFIPHQLFVYFSDKISAEPGSRDHCFMPQLGKPPPPAESATPYYHDSDLPVP
jgi:hypothetical protein